MCPVTTDRDDNERPGRRRLGKLIGLAGILLVPLLVIWWPGCRQYPPVSTRESLALMKLLYSACNTRDEVRLARVEQGVDKLTREGRIGPAEQKSFTSIIDMGKAGDWEKAEKAAYKFAQDQVGAVRPGDGHQ